ncbi:hypothetical protein [Lamprocystis purpurea]|jgi:hypothetical protein|uniref:hypothetical protein n=1 Tax=Lamprocystis purpurea TaxID=61598 RepID=UPI00037BBF81|nr:hypothetical protein [Lamprocystis purpurea]
MERIVNLHIERLPQGLYLATSDAIPGLVAHTLAETLEIARDVSRRLMEAQAARDGSVQLEAPRDAFDYPLVVGA